MEPTLLSSISAKTTTNSTTMSIISLSKSLNSHSTPLTAHLHRRFSVIRPGQLAYLHAKLIHVGPSSLVRGLGSVQPRRNQFQFVANYAASFSAAGGGSSGIDGNSGGRGGEGDGAADGGDAKPAAVAADVPSLSSDVIILDVGGMTCGGCAASVKRILESQPQVSSASVNLTTETAIIWPISEAKGAPNWKKEIGETLANHLTSCGFKSSLRDQGAVDGDVQL